MAKKAHGIGQLTATEQQPGYSPERLAKQIEGCLPPIKKIDERGFTYWVYPKDKKHPRWKEKPISIKAGKIKAAKLTIEEEQGLSFELPDYE
jgi:hypothetical protein